VFSVYLETGMGVYTVPISQSISSLSAVHAVHLRIVVTVSLCPVLRHARCTSGPLWSAAGAIALRDAKGHCSLAWQKLGTRDDFSPTHWVERTWIVYIVLFFTGSLSKPPAAAYAQLASNTPSTIPAGCSGPRSYLYDQG
jgi:hypothetical protein